MNPAGPRQMAWTDATAISLIIFLLPGVRGNID
jgi:hypothetical protein